MKTPIDEIWSVGDHCSNDKETLVLVLREDLPVNEGGCAVDNNKIIDDLIEENSILKAEIERLRGYQAGYAGLIEDNSTYEDEIEMLKELLDPIIKAFTVQGPVPAYHEYVKNGLKKEWPVLYRAIDRAVNEYR